MLSVFHKHTFRARAHHHMLHLVYKERPLVLDSMCSQIHHHLPPPTPEVWDCLCLKLHHIHSVDPCLKLAPHFIADLPIPINRNLLFLLPCYLDSSL